MFFKRKFKVGCRRRHHHHHQDTRVPKKWWQGSSSFSGDVGNEGIENEKKYTVGAEGKPRWIDEWCWCLVQYIFSKNTGEIRWWYATAETTDYISCACAVIIEKRQKARAGLDEAAALMRRGRSNQLVACVCVCVDSLFRLDEKFVDTKTSGGKARKRKQDLLRLLDGSADSFFFRASLTVPLPILYLSFYYFFGRAFLFSSPFVLLRVARHQTTLSLPTPRVASLAQTWTVVGLSCYCCCFRFHQFLLFSGFRLDVVWSRDWAPSICILVFVFHSQLAYV